MSDIFGKTRPSTGSLRRSSQNSPLGSPQHCSGLGGQGKKGDGFRLLDRVRTKVKKEGVVSITPQLAAEVVQAYLLPLFESNTRQLSAQHRSEAFGFSLPPTPSDQPTLYEELKLSSQLLSQLKDSQAFAEALKRDLKDAVIREQSTLKEVNVHKEAAMEATTRLTMLIAAQNTVTKVSQDRVLSTIFLASQMKQLQENLKKEEEKSKHYASLLHEERSKSDKLRNHSAELEYNNSLLTMESAIMGERLKGLYQAIEQLTESKGPEELLKTEVRTVTEAAVVVCATMEALRGEFERVAGDRDECRGDLAEMTQIRKETMEEKGRLARMARDRMIALQKALTAAEEERDHLRAEDQKQQKRFNDLSEEFGKLRTKMQQYRQRRKLYGEAEERICKNCQKVYIESENFNWSCRIHQSEFGDDMWWCCGKPGKDAAGCRISKHESKEDDEDADLSKKEQEALRHAMQKCPVPLT